MAANQDEFVYVTWQERQRNIEAMEYLARAERHKAIIKKHRQRAE